MAKQVSFHTLMQYTAQLVEQASARLKIEDHHADCPVRYGASADCVWPLAVCVPDDFDLMVEAARDSSSGLWDDNEPLEEE